MKQKFTLSLIFLCVTLSVLPQGFNTTPVKWTLPDGGQFRNKISYGFNSYYGQATTSDDTNSQTWSLTDMNGDGKVDLVVCSEGDAAKPTVFKDAGVPYWKVYLSDGVSFSKTYTEWIVPSGGMNGYGFYTTSGFATSSGSESWGLMDIDTDGKTDLVVFSKYTGTNYPGVFYSSTIGYYWKVYRNTGSGFETTATTWVVPNGEGQSYAGTSYGYNYSTGILYNNSTTSESWGLMDIDGDKKIDLVVYAYNYNPARTYGFNGSTSNFYWKVYKNTGSGFSTTYTSWSLPNGGQVGPWLYYYGYNNSYGYATNSTSETWNVTDIDGDGKPDLVVCSTGNSPAQPFGTSSSPAWKVYKNTGSGFASTSATWAIPASNYVNTYGTATASGAETWGMMDMDQDGLQDLVVYSYDSPNKVFGYDTDNPYWKWYKNSGTGFSSTLSKWSLHYGGLKRKGVLYGYNNSYGTTSADDDDDSQTWSVMDINNDGKLEQIIHSYDYSPAITFKDDNGSFWKILSLGDQGDQSTLSVSKTDYYLLQAAKDTSFDIVSNGDWTISSSATWVKINKTYGANNATVSFSVQANTTNVIRSATILVQGGAKPVTINITQYAPGYHFLVLSTNSLNIGAEENSTATFGIISDSPWSISFSNNFLTADVTSGSKNATITLTADPNYTLTSRVCQATVAIQGISQTLNITQAAFVPVLDVSTNQADLTSPGESTVSFDITSNISWKTDLGSSDWLYISPWSGSLDKKVDIIAQANKTGIARSATIELSSNDNRYQLSKTITVAQTAAKLNLSVTALNMAAENNSNAYFSVLSDADEWSITSSDSWLIPSTGKGSYNASVTLTGQTNTLITSRTATITVSGYGITKTITVTQAGSAPKLSIIAGPISLPAAGGSSSTFNISSNTNWTVSSSQSWLNVSNESGSGDATITVTASSTNTTTTDRQAIVTISGAGTSYQLSVTQAFSGATLTVSNTTLGVGATEGSEASFSITSNADWTVRCSESWLIADKGYGTGNGNVTIKAVENPLLSERTASVFVSGAGKTLEIIITQAAGTLSLLTSTNAITIGASEGSTGLFSITSNTSWTISCSDSWLSASLNSGSGNASVLITASANTASAERVATMTISITGVTRTITVTQSFTGATLSVPTTLVNLSSGSSTGTFEIVSNASWTVSCPDSWLTLSPLSGTGNKTITITALTNSTITPRAATIIVSGSGITQSVTVNQAAAAEALNVSSNTLDIGATTGATVTFTITSNISWYISNSDAWITAYPTFGSGDATVTLTATSNPTSSPRNGSVTVSGSRLTQTINVNQAAGSTGVGALQEEDIRIYPNPVTDKLFVQFSKDISAADHICIYTISGTLVLSQPVNDKLNEIDLSKCATGIYLIRINNCTFKFNKQ
ncbi:MAG TPA: BACON domain-containing carbohydrate-binding protein [Bacteroidales bacterium]